MNPRLLINQDTLVRPRLNTLIQEGLQHPPLVLLAGPGYGKTQAMTDYLKQTNTKYFWLRLSKLDNLPTHFWRHLVLLLNQDNPELFSRLQEDEFPSNLASFDVFARLLFKAFSGQREIVWVFDDFGEIHDPQVVEFIKMLADAAPLNIRIALLSNALDSTESIAFLSGKHFLILASDLRFTQNEIAELYLMQDMILEQRELDTLDHYTEGWPLPLHLLALQQIRMPRKMNQKGPLPNHVITSIFEERFFSAYPRSQQILLVKLSLLNSFSLSFAMDLYEGKRSDLEELASHVFLIREPATGWYFFHHLYHMFLQDRLYMLSLQEERRTWKQAADYYKAEGNAIEAITCYRKCEARVEMLQVICEYIRQENEITYENAPFFLEHLDLLTSEEVEAHPVTEHLRAIININLLQFKKAEELLKNLAVKLHAQDTPEAHSLLGEVYGAMGTIHMITNREDFGLLYKKAVSYLPEGSHFHNTNRLSTRNNHVFVLPDNQPGARKRMERAMQSGMVWVQQFLHGSMSGKEHLFSAEGAYLAYELSEAKQYAYRAIYKSKAKAQHDLVCSSHLLLARVALAEGDFDEMSRQIQDIVKYADTCGSGVVNEIRDTALGWYYTKLRDDKRIPQSIYTMNDDSKPMWSYGRSQIVYAIHLIHAEAYAQMVGMLEYPKGPFFLQGVTPDRITLHIILAIGYYYLGNRKAAIHSLWTAYDMSYHNGLITLFMESGKHMLLLLDEVRRQSDFSFDPNWLNKIEKAAGIYIKQTAKVCAAYQKQNPQEPKIKSPLSKREQAVLQSLSQGMTREEIAVEQYISVNTVKSVIRSIYTKLDANNRAEAVSIAITNGYIDSHQF